MKTLWIRADASPEMGYGHLTRCMAIAKQLTYSIRLATQSSIEQDGIDVVNIQSETDFIERLLPHDLVLLDHYGYDAELQQAILQRGSYLIVISDETANPVFADFIINPTFGVVSSQYNSLPQTLFAVGLEGSILRPPFIEAAKANHQRTPNTELMICFGGSDPKNLTAEVLKQLDAKQFEAIHIVIGPGYTHELDETQLAAAPYVIHRNLQADEMASLMKRCYWGIFPTSGILLEALSCNMHIVAGYYVDNQLNVYQKHLQAGNFVDAKTFAPDEIRTALHHMKDFQGPKQKPDGTSMDRIIRLIEFLADTTTFSIREATLADTDTTFVWANDSRTRQFAFNQESIPFTDHVKWFTQKIQSENCAYYILERNKQALGSIRFDIQDSIATISYLVAPELHGQGLGTRLMQVGLKHLSQQPIFTKINAIQGYVFQENKASQKTFERFGFKRSQAENLYLFTKAISHDGNTSI